MSKLIYKIEQSVTDLTVAIKNGDILGKMADSKSLLNMFLDLKKDTNTLEADIRQVINLELQKRQFIILNDDRFLSDKLNQIQVMQEHLDNLIQILKETPNNKEYTDGILNLVLGHLDRFIVALAKLKHDDQELAKIYQALADM